MLFTAALLALAGCAAVPRGTPTAAPTAAAPTVAAAAPTAAPTATATKPAPREQAAGNAKVTPVSIPLLGDQLTAGWDTQYGWSTQFEVSPDAGPAGAKAYRATFAGESSGLFLAVKQDSPVRYLTANYVGARVWVNPGAQELRADQLKVAVLSSDRHAYWEMSEAPVPFDPVVTASEAPLPTAPALGGVLPANAWTEVEIRFDQLPKPPAGRYLTGLYLRADKLAGRTLQLSRLELLALPDDTPPQALAASEVNDTALRVTFNKDVDPVAAANPANYRIRSDNDPAYSAPQAPAAVRYEPETRSAVLTVSAPLQPGASYAVEVQQVKDLAPRPNVQAGAAALTFTAGVLQVTVDLGQAGRPISKAIYGVAPPSGPDMAAYMQALRPSLANWGGNPTSRYNWELGNAFNAGSDWEYRNTDYGNPSGSISDKFIADAQAAGADVRLTLPTLGWVAKNTDSNTCSFVGKDGKCYNPGANCQKPGATADPNAANVPVDVNWVVRWVKHVLDDKGFNVRFFAMDNEPDLWGFTHYDIHPKCATYQEILDKYLTYATAVRAAAPKAELLGPVSCCWYFYWNSPAGDADKAKNGKQDFLPWFLAQVRQNDTKTGVRTLDALDIHYYPENVYNDKADPETAAARLEATRGLWDKSYVDPSWIGQAVNLIPRMKQIIAENYPGTKLFISEWNFGGEKSMSGALAIADALGIFGEQDLYAASYYHSPERNSPGFFGFKMYTNYDDQGGRFGDLALPVDSTNREQVAAYAARDSATGKVTVLLINKLPDRSLPITLNLDGADGALARAELFRYAADHQDGIVRENAAVAANGSLTLPPYSITLLVLPGEGK